MTAPPSNHRATAMPAAATAAADPATETGLGIALMVLAVGLVGGGAQIAMTNAFRLADVSIVAPFDYTGMIWAAILGYAVWGDVPGPNIWIGVAIVTASGLYILRREANLGLRRGIARRLQARR